MDGFGLPKSTDEEKKHRSSVIEEASKYAMQVPLMTAETALASMEVMKQMVQQGNPNSVTDAGVGALCARTAVLGAVMNVRINASGIKDKTFTEELLIKATAVEQQAEAAEAEIRKLVAEKIK